MKVLGVLSSGDSTQVATSKNLNSSLELAYQNDRGVKSNLVSLYVDSLPFNFHILAFTETWLLTDVI